MTDGQVLNAVLSTHEAYSTDDGIKSIVFIENVSRIKYDMLTWAALRTRIITYFVSCQRPKSI